MGLTLDTGALIAVEDVQRGRTSDRRIAFARALSERAVRVTVPAVVVAEWWRARPGQPWDRMVESRYEIEDFDRLTAKQVGALLNKVVGTQRDGRERLLLVDAAVVIGAAARNDVIYTTDNTDIAHLATLHGYDEKRVKYL